MAKKTLEPKIMLEREYNVPLRAGWLKVAKYKRANKAIKTLKEFIARHMKIYDRDLRKIKIDIILNNEIRFRGSKKPPAKIKVKARKFNDGIVRVELVEIPKHVEFARLREMKKLEKIEKTEMKAEKIEEEKKTEEKELEQIEKHEEIKKEDIEAREKEEASREAEMNIAKQKAREKKHISKDKNVRIFRKALSK
ncbi:MAG: 50S ribosomal protein L31e [Nanoarchaeota archaeon]